MYKTNSYSVDVAKIFGPVSAIYISMLMNFGCEKIEDTIDLDRVKVFNCTGIDIEKQEEVEKLLSSLGVIIIKKFRGNDDKNHYSLNFDRMTSIMSNPTLTKNIEEELKIKKKKKELSKESKHEIKIKQLKSCINVSDEALRQHLCDWIDAVMERNYITKQGVKINIEELLKFSTDQDTLINVVNIATKNGYRDLTWAMNRVKENSKASGNNFASYSDIKGNSNNLCNEAF